MNKAGKVAALILAAGKGTRMKSPLPKVMHILEGRPLLNWVIDQARGIGARRIVIVVGHQARAVREAFSEQEVVFVEQSPQLGTGHAVLVARQALADYDGPVLILCGDVPLLKNETLAAFLSSHLAETATVSLMTARLDNPGGYGRIVKDSQQNLVRIVEDKDADAEERKIDEINTGIYCVDRNFLFAAVEGLSCDNAQKEYYLTDIIAWGAKREVKMIAFPIDDASEAMGINTPADLEQAEQIARRGDQK